MTTKRILPSLTALQFFEASVRHMSFTRAARELNVTQSAVSRQIRQLEQYVGRPLFRRHKQRLVLTEPGETYAAAVRLSLDHSQLPKPLQVDALADRDWHVDAKTLHWSFVPAPEK